MKWLPKQNTNTRSILPEQAPRMSRRQERICNFHLLQLTLELDIHEITTG